MRIFITENGSILKYDTADNSWSILVPPNNLQNLAKWQVIPTTCTPPYLTERQRRDIMTKRNFYPENLITQFSVINSNSTNVKEIYVENISSTKFADVGTIQLRTTLGDSALTEAVTTVQSGPRKGSVYFPLLYSINFIDFAKTAEATFSIKDINNMEVITALWSNRILRATAAKEAREIHTYDLNNRIDDDAVGKRYEELRKQPTQKINSCETLLTFAKAEVTRLKKPFTFFAAKKISAINLAINAIESQIEQAENKILVEESYKQIARESGLIDALAIHRFFTKSRKAKNDISTSSIFSLESNSPYITRVI